MKLTEHLPRQPTWLLVSRMLREQSRDMLEHLAMCLRLRDRARLAAEDLAVPDSAWARTAVERTCSPYPVDGRPISVSRCGGAAAVAAATPRRDRAGA